MKQTDLSIRKTDEDDSDKAKRNSSENWLVRRREKNGTLKHIVTLTSKPTEKDLMMFGVGSYSIQKIVGRKFSKAEKITITSVPEDTNIIPQIAPTQVLQHRSQLAKPEPPKSIAATEELPPPLVRKRKVRKKKVRRNGDLIKQYASQIAPEKTLLIHSDTPTKINNTSKLERITNIKQKGLQTSSITSIAPKKTDMKTTCSDRSEVVGAGGKLQTTLDSQKEYHLDDFRRGTEEKAVFCDLCGKRICDVNDLWLSRDEMTKCSSCGKYFCRDCYQAHNCPLSIVCSWCKERVASSSAITADYCRRIFCSPRCRDLCRRENRDNLDCQGCMDEEVGEGMEETDESEERIEKFYCPICDTLILDEDGVMSNGAVYCEDDECDRFFCSRRCYRRYHKREGLNHECSMWKEIANSED